MQSRYKRQGISTACNGRVGITSRTVAGFVCVGCGGIKDKQGLPALSRGTVVVNKYAQKITMNNMSSGTEPIVNGNQHVLTVGHSECIPRNAEEASMGDKMRFYELYKSAEDKETFIASMSDMFKTNWKMLVALNK
jgi:hypothetical protein